MKCYEKTKRAARFIKVAAQPRRATVAVSPLRLPRGVSPRAPVGEAVQLLQRQYRS